VFLYIIIDFIGNRFNKETFYIRAFILFLTIFLITGSAMSYLIKERVDEANINKTHDGALQTELAVEKMLAGKNFYTEDYKDTVLDEWLDGRIRTLRGSIENPALYHYVYLPLTVIMTVPFFKLGQVFFNFYDQRILIYLFYILSLFFLFRVVPNKENKLTAVVLFGLNILFLEYVLGGFNDIFILLFFLVMAFFMQKKRYVAASLMFACALLTKQTAWLMIPFYAFFLLYQKDTIKEAIIFTLKKAWLAVLAVVGGLLPFVILDFKSFWQNVYMYPAGLLETSYPVAGFGLSSLLFFSRVIESVGDYYPFYWWQLLFVFPILILLLVWQKKHNTLSFLFFGYSIFLLLFWFFSRFFNPNYVIFVFQLLVISYFLYQPQNSKNTIGKNYIF